MKKLFLISIFLIYIASCMAQGYKIDLKINGLSNQEVYLGYYYGGKTYVTDTTFLNNNGYGFFRGDEPLEQGMYLIVYPSKSYFDFIIDKDQHFYIECDASANFQNVKIEGSEENTEFFNYQRFTQKLTAEYNSLSKDDPKRNTLIEERKNYTQNIINKNKESFFSKFLLSLESVIIPDNLNEDQKYFYYVEHYFDNYDFSCKGLLRTPTFSGNFLKFFDKVILKTPENEIKYVDELISKAKEAENDKMYQYMISSLYNYYSQSKIMTHEQVYVYIAKKYYLSNQTDWTKPGFLDDLYDQISKTELCLIGESAQEINGVDINNKDQSLYSTDADFTILIFWNQDCNNCHKYLQSLKDNYYKLNQNKKVEIFAIGTGYEKQEWESYIKKNNLYNFININESNLKSDIRKLYNLTSTPLLYVLNRNKVIIAKKLVVDDAIDIIESYTEPPVSIHALLNKENFERKKNIIQNTTVFSSANNVFNIDNDIPNTYIKNQFKYALIIGNENYSKFQLSESKDINVSFAINDALIFKEYAEKTLGVPERNITLLTDATMGQTLYALSKINKLSKYSSGNAEILFYYAGHGASNENSKETYIVPIDGSAINLESAIKLDDIFNRLSEFENKGVTAFIDACFSGGARDEGLKSVRGVRVKPKPNQLKNGMTVFYASSENQSINKHPNSEHGLFTYNLLKKIKENKGVINFGDLDRFLQEEVNSMSLSIGTKPQSPYVNSSDPYWKNKSLIQASNTASNVEENEVNVDSAIPVTNKNRPKSFALVIGNEDYNSYQIDLHSEANVDFALNDATIFNKYLINTIGIPEENTILLKNATLSQINLGLNLLEEKVKKAGKADQIIFYFAGHGLPDAEKQPYIIPVDISGHNVTSGIKLNELYKRLSSLNSDKVTVFLDACFSGGARNQGLVSLRGVKVQPKENSLTGNLIVFSSSSGDEESASFKNNYHGLFTYFILKKFKETKGDLSYKEFADYIQQVIPLESVKINNKEQNPQINLSPTLTSNWVNWKF